MTPAVSQSAATRRGRGVRGEEVAARHLLASGYAIIERNFRCKAGEIDIIAQKAGVIVFVEVKAWAALGRADLEYSINARKRRRISETARYFLMNRPHFMGRSCRFDVVFIENRDSRSGVHHIENAFSGAVG